MTFDLIQRLKTCSAEERRAIAMELAQTQSDKTVKELIRLTKGKGYTSITLDEQLATIDALGETGNVKALNYLKRISRASVEYRSEHWERGHQYGYNTWVVDETGVTEHEFVDFPYAPEPLRHALRYNAEDSDFRGSNFRHVVPFTLKWIGIKFDQSMRETIRPADYSKYPYTKEDHDRAYQKIEESIRKLESTVEKRPA